MDREIYEFEVTKITGIFEGRFFRASGFSLANLMVNPARSARVIHIKYVSK